MIERGFWRHTESGQIWAVEIEDERPMRCVGPGLDGRRRTLHRWQAFVLQQLCRLRNCREVYTRAPAGRAHRSCRVVPLK